MNLLPNLTISKGQLVGLSQKQDHAPKLPINSEGYILPSLHGITWLGATYDREFQDMEPSKSSGELLISNTERSLGIEFNNPEDHLMEARFRVGSKDRIPMAGKLNSHENIYVMGALGSRGFSLAPLLGEFISSMIHGYTQPNLNWHCTKFRSKPIYKLDSKLSIRTSEALGFCGECMEPCRHFVNPVHKVLSASRSLIETRK